LGGLNEDAMGKRAQVEAGHCQYDEQKEEQDFGAQRHA
jgi:hypothetical protein